MKTFLTVGFILSLLTASSCGLIQSDTRKVEAQQARLIGELSSSDQEGFLSYCHESFTWMQQGKAVGAKDPAKAFYLSVVQTTSFGGAELALKSFTEVQGNYLASGQLVVKQASSTSVTNTLVDVSLLWKKTTTGWKLARVKETSKRTTKNN